MATFKAVVRKQRADGPCPVYIRVCHATKVEYINTNKIVSPKYLTKNKDIKDPLVNEYCSREILRFSAKVNSKDVRQFSLQELIQFLTEEISEPCFTDYARNFIDKMINSGYERNAKTYKAALKSLELSAGTNKIMFPLLSSANPDTTLTDNGGLPM